MKIYDAFRITRRLRQRAVCALLLAAIVCLAQFYSLRDARASPPAMIAQDVSQIARLLAHDGTPNDSLGSSLWLPSSDRAARACRAYNNRPSAQRCSRPSRSKSITKAKF